MPGAHPAPPSSECPPWGRPAPPHSSRRLPRRKAGLRPVPSANAPRTASHLASGAAFAYLLPTWGVVWPRRVSPGGIMSYFGGAQSDGRRTGLNPRLIGALLIAVVGIAMYMFNTEVNPVTGEKQHIAMSVDQEKALGLQAAPEMAAQMGGAVDPERDPQ